MKHSLLSMLIPVLLLLCGCSSNDAISFEGVNGEEFPYECPVTAVTDAGDSLILGTSRGDIVSYNMSDGSFRHVYHDARGRLVYNIIRCEDGSLIYSVQNGGINHVDVDGTVTVYEIVPEKGMNYSAYRVIHDDGHIYAATSNGVYHWTMPETRGVRLDAAVQEDLNDVISSRFYSIEADGQAYICSGEAGQYSIDAEGNVSTIDTSSISASHGSMILYKDGRIFKDGKFLADLKIPALDFVSDGIHIYALSLSSIEILDAVSGEHLMTVNMLEERGTEKNVSCRSFCLIKDDYLYFVPSGCALYRLPLYRHWTESEEVVQICPAGESSAYVLTRDNDLYRFDAENSDVSYRRSFDKSSDIKLVGAYNDQLVVMIDGRYHQLGGLRLADEVLLSDLNTMSKTKVLWHLMDGQYMYQGQVDRIRKYDGADSWRLCGEFEKDDSFEDDPTRVEYYPERASLNEHDLFVYTMHYGTFWLDSGRFNKLKSLDDVVMKDIEAERNAIYALTDEAVVRMMKITNELSVADFDNPAYRHFSDIVAIDANAFIAYTTYNNRSIRGVVRFEQDSEGRWTSSRKLSTNRVHGGVRMGECALVGGTMGLSLHSSDGSMDVVTVPEPTFFQKNVLAWNYPWGIVIYIVVLLGALYVIFWCAMSCRKYYLKYRYAKIHDDFCKWVKSEYDGMYVWSLAKQIKKVSPDCRRLAANIAMFRDFSAELRKLDDFMNDVSDLYEQVKKLPPMDIETQNRDRIRALKDSMEILCRPDHPFGNSIIRAWGKSTVQPIRTMMLLPLKFKIKFMQVFDSRTGTEKMDFKAFMDRNRASILDRKLEIRDLVALAAYEAIVSEKGPADA